MGTPQRIFLENEFMKNPKPSTEEKSRYAQMFGLPIAKINVGSYPRDLQCV
jgi:hypothetical protein